MSGIVLSSSVRQNLLSLQSTADLLATTQSRLSTGKKVNTALDNPTNFFTAQSLDGRASDISNLLDGIGNGVQVLQAANTGITRSRSWSIPRSRSLTRRCRPRSVTRPSPTSLRRLPARLRPTFAVPLPSPARPRPATSSRTAPRAATHAITGAITLGGTPLRWLRRGR